jgi:hypothetical protein
MVRSSNAATVIYRGGVALLGLLLYVRIVRVLPWSHTLDDSLMFVRYADHVIHAGSVAWNVPGPPTYGLTSLAYLLVVVPVRMLVPDSAGTAAVLASLASGALFLLLLTLLVARFHGATSPTTRRAATLFAAAALMAVSFTLCFHVSSGMDTMFATAALTALLLGYLRDGERPSRVLTVALGVSTALLFLVRPDLMIYGVGIPATALVLARDSVTRRRLATVLGVAAISLAVELLLTAHYFGKPLPLPFYAKGMHSYGEHIVAVYRAMAGDQFTTYVTRHLPLFAVLLVLGPYLVASQGVRVFTPVEVGVAASTAVFLAYFRFFVLQIMPHECRFYFPTLPALVFLSVRCVVLAIERPGPIQRWFERAKAFVSATVAAHPRFARIVAVAALAVFALVALVRTHQANASIATVRAQHTFDVSSQYADRGTNYWYRLDEVSALPDDLVLGTTEVGMPCALNPSKTILDLAGLNDTDVVRQGFLINRVVQRYRPDFVYMPHPDYLEMNRALMDDPDFIREYEIFPGDQLGTEMGVALRRDSTYYRQMIAIVREGPRRR